MANILEYVISIRDKATAAAKKIEAAVGAVPKEIDAINKKATAVQSKLSAVFNAVYTKARNAVAGPRFLTKSIDELEEQLKEVNRVRFGTVLKSEFKSATIEANRLEKQISRLRAGIGGGGIGGKIAGWRKDFADSIPGANLIKNPLTMAGAAIGGLWSTTEKAMEAGKEKMKLQVLTGSAEIGGALYDGLTKFATDTVFGNELYGYATQMLANGIKDSNVMPLMKVLGDISMGDSEKLGQLSLAFSQVVGKGHLAGQELLQLINAGFNPLQVLSEKTGRSMSSLTDDMSKGKIKVEDVAKAMQLATGPGGKFNNMLQKVADTPYGQLENMKGQMSQWAISIGNTFLPLASKLMNLLMWMGDKIGPYLQPVAVIIGVLAAGLLGVAAAQWLWNIAAAANPFVLIVIAAIAAIAYLVSAFSGWGNAWNNLMKGLKYTWLGFTGSFKLLWIQTVDKFMWGVEKIEKAWYKVKSLWDEDGANAGLAKLNTEAQQRSKEIAYQKGLNKVYDNMAGEAFGNVFGDKGLHSSGKSLGDTLNKIKGAALPGLNFKGAGASTPGDTGTAKSREAVATGGTKNTTINIQIGKQEANVTVVTNSLKEGVSKIRDMIIEEMTRAAAMGAALAG